MLGLEGNLEGVVELVLCHSRENEVLRVRKIRLGGSVDVAQKLGNLPDSVRTVIEEENFVIIYLCQSWIHK